MANIPPQRLATWINSETLLAEDGGVSSAISPTRAVTSVHVDFGSTALVETTIEKPDFAILCRQGCDSRDGSEMLRSSLGMGRIGTSNRRRQLSGPKLTSFRHFGN